MFLTANTAGSISSCWFLFDAMSRWFMERGETEAAVLAPGRREPILGLRKAVFGSVDIAKYVRTGAISGETKPFDGTMVYTEYGGESVAGTSTLWFNMHATEPIYYLVFLFAACIPVTALMIARHYIGKSVRHTEKLDGIEASSGTTAERKQEHVDSARLQHV
jgi:hypothetical protein